MSRRPDAYERERQAEMDAARAREIAEETADRITPEGRDLPSLATWASSAVRASIVRQYVRAELVEPAVARMFAIGMGAARFEVPTALGNIVEIPAPAAVQVEALSKIIDIGVPRTVGLVDGDGETLPGVFALGTAELEAVQSRAAEQRMARAAEVFAAEGDDPMRARIEAGEFEEIEVVEGIDSPGTVAEDIAPPPLSDEPTPEQRILARRRAAKRNGHG